jgi:hypothetical protein
MALSNTMAGKRILPGRKIAGDLMVCGRQSSQAHRHDKVG